MSISIERITDRDMFFKFVEIPSWGRNPGISVDLNLMWKPIETNEKYFYIINDADGVCGTVELLDCDTENPEITVEIKENKRSQGIGPAAVRMVCKAYKESQFAKSFSVSIKESNKHSIHMFEKLGATLIGETQPFLVDEKVEKIRFYTLMI